MKQSAISIRIPFGPIKGIQARIIIESRKKRDIENGRAPRSEESHLNEINEPGFTYADYLKYKPE